MHLRKLSYCALFFVVLSIIACGGGEKKEESATTPSTSAPGAAPSGGGNVYDASKATASVTGKISFEGSAPAGAKLPLTPECKQAHGGDQTDEAVKVNSNQTLKDVFVYVKQGAEKWTYNMPAKEAVLDQVGCRYTPHIVTVGANQPLKIVNSDPFLHNVHPLPKAPGNEPFNQGMPVKGMKIEHTFKTPEIMIPVKCDVHRWMQAYIAVMNHPFYAVTGDDGSFKIEKLPAGSYTLEAWHEKYGPQTQQLTVADNESKEVNFSYKAS